MTATTQVSAYISEETKAAIDAYVKRRGIKKAYLIDEALQHHLQALSEIPEDLVIPSRLVLTKRTSNLRIPRSARHQHTHPATVAKRIRCAHALVCVVTKSGVAVEGHQRETTATQSRISSGGIVIPANNSVIAAKKPRRHNNSIGRPRYQAPNSKPAQIAMISSKSSPPCIRTCPRHLHHDSKTGSAHFFPW